MVRSASEPVIGRAFARPVGASPTMRPLCPPHPSRRGRGAALRMRSGRAALPAISGCSLKNSPALCRIVGSRFCSQQQKAWEEIMINPTDLPNPQKIAADGLDRRGLLKSAAALAATTMIASNASARDFGPRAEPQRYPDPDIVVIDDKRFKAKVGNTAVKRLHRGCLWPGGPAWNAGGQYLVWSDIPNNRQLRYLDDDGHISEQFHKPSNAANGNTLDFEGRQISAERTRLILFEHNGAIPALPEQANGKQLNGPNDMVVHPNDKSIWFTDPGYGAISIYEGQKANSGSNQPS